MRGLVRGLPFRVVGLAVLLMAPGCAIEHPGLSASSMSKMPWFNFQVVPSKKDSPNYQRSIARETSTPVELRHASSPPASNGIQWPEFRLPGLKREALILPRTDDVIRIPTKSATEEERVEHIEFD